MRVIILLAIATLLAPLGEANDIARRHYLLGIAAERRGAQLEAYSQYLQARAAAPSKRKYLRAAERLRAATAQAIAIRAASDSIPIEGDRETTRFRPPLPFEREDPLLHALGAIELEPEGKLATFRFEATIEEAYRRVCEEYGIGALFDEGFQESQTIRFNLTDVDFENALLALNEVATAFVVPLTPALLLVADDTPAKRTELEPVVTISVPIPEAVTPQDATEAAQAVQQTLEIQRLFVVPSRGIVTIRDSPTKARMARLLFERLLVPSSELVLEIELVAYNGDRNTELGLGLPSIFSITNYSTILNAVPPEPNGSEIRIGGGETVLGIGVGDAQALATLRSGVGSTAQQLSVRASDGTQAQVRIGERFPIVTASFGPGSGIDLDQPNLASRLPPPTVTFEDLGLSIDVTPKVHGGGEVSLQLLAEFNLLAGGSLNGVPILVNRTLESQVRLREGEAAIVAGMAIDETRTSRTTSLGLAGIPIVSDLLSQTNRQTNSTDLLILVRPRIVRLPASEVLRELTIRFGAEQRPLQAL